MAELTVFLIFFVFERVSELVRFTHFAVLTAASKYVQSGIPNKAHMSTAGWAIRHAVSVCHGFTRVQCFYPGTTEFEILKWPYFSRQWLQHSTALHDTPQDLYDTMDLKFTTGNGIYFSLCDTKSRIRTY